MAPENWREQRIQRFDADREIAPIEDGLAAHDPNAVTAALDYLERDPRAFRTGYAKQRLLARLRSPNLDAGERARMRALALRAVDHSFQGASREYVKLAPRVANNEMRRALRARLHSPDFHIAWRSLMLLVAIPNAGLTTADVTAARTVIRQQAARAQWVELSYALRFWSDEWAEELRRLAKRERDLGARRLLDAHRQQERVRKWRASRRR